MALREGLALRLPPGLSFSVTQGHVAHAAPLYNGCRPWSIFRDEGPSALTSGKIAGMADHPPTIDRWDDATGENLIEQIAAVGDYVVALATYHAAGQRWPKDKITLRNRARIVEKSWRDFGG